MENSTISVLNELAQVYELARKLSDNLHQPLQIELCRTIAEEIIGSVEKAIGMAKAATGGSNGGEPLFSNNQEMSKKRKILPTWTSQVNASTMRGTELPDDGYTWRKYGQKAILNAKHPRLRSKNTSFYQRQYRQERGEIILCGYQTQLAFGDESDAATSPGIEQYRAAVLSSTEPVPSRRAYYRCTHRKKQGCLAMKLVQRSDDNPLVFEITYRGTHTCSSMKQLQETDQSLFDQRNSLRMKTEGLNFEAKDSTSLIFFPSTPLNPEEDLFCSSPNLESCFLSSFSSPFMSPTTSESNCLPLSPCQKLSQGNPNADLTGIISMATSMTNLTMTDMDLFPY